MGSQTSPRQLDPGPTEVQGAGDCRLDLGPIEVYQPAIGSGLRLDPGEDQAGTPVLTTVVRQGPLSMGRHSASGFPCQNRYHWPENRPGG